MRGLRFYEQQFPFPQGASAGPYPKLLVSPGLGNYRPNSAFYRGIVNGTSRTLGQSITGIDWTDPTIWLGGAAALFALHMIWKKRGRRRRR